MDLQGRRKIEEAMIANVDTKVVEALETVDSDLISLSSGVVLRVKQAPPLTLIKVMAAFPRPKPPVYRNETMGREVENPDDPDYLERLQAHKTESSSALLNALILLGTELVSTPKKFPKPDENGWLEEYSELGIPAKPESKAWRYLNWVMFKAVANEKDLELIQKAVGRRSGVPESTVKSAETFSGSDETDR
jgi:hypothetical protein